MKSPRMLAVAAFVLVIGITPIGGITSGGVFETWSSDGYHAPVRVTLHDRTGLVRALGPVVPDTESADPRILHVHLNGGCGGYWVNLDFRRSEGGYVLEQRSDRIGCLFDIILGYGTVAISLWAPIDTSTVEIIRHH